MWLHYVRVRVDVCMSDFDVQYLFEIRGTPQNHSGTRHIPAFVLAGNQQHNPHTVSETFIVAHGFHGGLAAASLTHSSFQESLHGPASQVKSNNILKF